MPFCSTCKLQGEDETLFANHNVGQWSLCPYHPRYKGDDKRAPIQRPPDDDADAALLSALPFDSRSVAGAAVAGPVSTPGFSEATAPQDLIKAMFKGTLTKTDCVTHLAVAIASETGSSKRAQLQGAYDVAEKFDPSTTGAAKSATHASKDIVTNMEKHGKLVGSLISTHHKIALEFHLKAPTSTGAKTVYQLANGEQVVQYAANEDIVDVDMLHMVLVDWCYVVVVCGYLTNTEAREVHRFAARSLKLDPDACKCVYRTTIELLKLHDSDPSVSLVDIYTKHKDAVHMDVQRIAGWTGNCVPCDNKLKTDGPPQANTSQTIPGFAPGDKRLTAPWPRRGVCWPWTNGKQCTQLDAKGECVHKQWHDKCGKPYHDASGQKRSCQGKHKAVDCKDH
jgi:hypothetical protein